LNKFRVAVCAGVFLGFALMAGCGGGYYAGVTVGPPAPVVETPYGVAPGPGYIWTPGYYDWSGGAWAWRRGEWRRRPHPMDRWVAPRWDRDHGRYHHHPGGWQHGHHMHH
jgi:hypothetical protein